MNLKYRFFNINFIKGLFGFISLSINEEILDDKQNYKLIGFLIIFILWVYTIEYIIYICNEKIYRNIQILKSIILSIPILIILFTNYNILKYMIIFIFFISLYIINFTYLILYIYNKYKLNELIEINIDNN